MFLKTDSRWRCSSRDVLHENTQSDFFVLAKNKKDEAMGLFTGTALTIQHTCNRLCKYINEWLKGEWSAKSMIER